MEILEELIDYHQEHQNMGQVVQLQQELASIASTRGSTRTALGKRKKPGRSGTTSTEGSQDDEAIEREEDGDNVDDDSEGPDQDAVNEFTETLSSDSGESDMKKLLVTGAFCNTNAFA